MLDSPKNRSVVIYIKMSNTLRIVSDLTLLKMGLSIWDWAFSIVIWSRFCFANDVSPHGDMITAFVRVRGHSLA